MRTIRRIPVIGALLLVILALASCGDDDGTGPVIPGPVTCERLYDFNDRDYGRGLCQAPDGTIWLFGSTYAAHPDSADGPDTVWSEDMLLMRLDGGGDTLHTVIIGDTGYAESGRRILPALDGGLIVAAEVTHMIFSRIFLYKILESGEVDWSQDFGYGQWNYVSDFIPLDEGYAFTGAGSVPSAGMELYLTRVDRLGGFPWEYTVDPERGAYGKAVAELPDQGLVLAGDIDDNVYLFRFDAAGDSLWARIIDLGGQENVQAVMATDDGGYTVCGLTQGGAGAGYFTLRTDSLGYQKSVNIAFLPADTWLYDVELLTGGEAVMCGQTTGAGYGAGYLAGADKNGNILWERQSGEPGVDLRLYEVTSLAGGGYGAVGIWKDLAENTSDVYFVRTDADGNVTDELPAAD